MPSRDDRHEFTLEADPLGDALLRILGPFAVLGADLATVRHDQTAAGVRVMVEVVSLDPAKAELLGRRLSQLACVRDVRIRRQPGLAVTGRPRLAAIASK